MLESNQDRHEVTFKFPPQLPQTNLQNIFATHHHKYKLTEIDKFNLYILNQTRQKRLRWLGHVLKMDRSSIPKIALRWTPAGKSPRGRPKTTWRKTIENELKSLDLTWREAEARAKNRAEWPHLVLTLCSDWSEG